MPIDRACDPTPGRIIVASKALTGGPAERSQPELRSIRVANKIATLGEMTGGIVHDFRNILCVIDAGLRQAEKRPVEPAHLSLCLAAMHEAVERGLQTTDRLLALTKQQESQAAAVDLNELLRKLEILLKFGAGPDVQVKLQFAEGVPLCCVDPGQFTSAILNLVVNSRDAMPEGGVLFISTRVVPLTLPESQSYVCVRVEDDGVGMSPETIAHVFDMYFTTKGESGTGLGIPQVRTLMNLVGGHINIESSPGAGTSFELFFPAIEPSMLSMPLWRQLDRWVNEGGAVAARSPTSGFPENATSR